MDDPRQYSGLVKAAQNAQFGDYQANCAMPLAKALGKKPRDVAIDIVKRLDLGPDFRIRFDVKVRQTSVSGFLGPFEDPLEFLRF